MRRAWIKNGIQAFEKSDKNSFTPIFLFLYLVARIHEDAYAKKKKKRIHVIIRE